MKELEATHDGPAELRLPESITTARMDLTVEGVKLQKNTAKAYRRKCEFDQMREVRLIEEKCNVLCRRRFVHPLQLLWDIAVKRWLTPVMLPPGRFKLATIPASTGSTPRGNIIISVMTKSDQSRAGACPLANNGCTASAWAILSDLARAAACPFRG